MPFLNQPPKRLLALDAMGVIYSEADDGNNLLYPFIVEKGGCEDIREIIHLWSAASLGKMSSVEFWRSAGLDPALEDEYLLKYRLTEGLIEFLDAMRSHGTELWCLSNNISEWSQKLCERFSLDQYFRGFIISGDTGTRKPDPAIYHYMLEKAGVRPCDATFVDDRLRNIAAADALGIAPILFNPVPQEREGHKYTTVSTFAELQGIL
jgi:putative hydrolase of the HAD superfamily